MRIQSILVVLNAHPERGRALKVAVVARRTGVSVRTLHYYEEIGLLSPSGRTASGHRLYTLSDVERLQQIRSLQQLGFSLSEIQACLETRQWDAKRVISDHLARVRSQIEALQRLESLLGWLAEVFHGRPHGSEETLEVLLSIVETTTMLDRYLTPQQQQRLQDHQTRALATVQPIVRAFERALQDGLPPQSEAAHLLLERWNEALDEITEGDESMEESLVTMLHENSGAREAHGISPALLAYMDAIADCSGAP